MFRKILVPLDGSPLAESILPHVVSLAGCEGGEALLLRVHVLPTFQYGMTDLAAYPVTPAEEDADRTAALEYLQGVAERLGAMGVRARALVRDGSVAECILQTAETEGVELIAMSTHGRSGIARWLIGSDANKVMRGAGVPVLLIRPVPQPYPNPKAGAVQHASHGQA